MKKNILLLIIFFLNLKLFGQKKEEFKEIYGHFLIKKHSVQTQKYADSVDNSITTIDAKWEVAVPLGSPMPPTPPPPPPLPKTAVFDRKDFIFHFIIMPKYYTQYTIPNEFKNDSILSYGIRDVIRIERENLNRTEFSPWRFEIYEGNPKNYGDFKRYYKFIAENKNVKKIIEGYNCFQVILKNIKTKRMVELFVTDEINLNYHPNFNYKEILENYYPLYLKIYHKDFPNDCYEEYKFYKYN